MLLLLLLLLLLLILSLLLLSLLILALLLLLFIIIIIIIIIVIIIIIINIIVVAFISSGCLRTIHSRKYNSAKIGLVECYNNLKLGVQVYQRLLPVFTPNKNSQGDGELSYTIFFIFYSIAPWG